MKFLLVEDNQSLSDNIVTYLDKEGYVGERATTYSEAMDRLISFHYDIVVLDLMLPDGDGLELLKYIKENQIDSGILIISAKGSLEDRIDGLDLGADDYLSKPFHLAELNSRLKALYRRRNFKGNNQINFDEIQVDVETYEVLVSNESISLTRKEFELLVFFIANKNRVLSRQSIAEHLWGDSADLLDSFDFVYQHIKNLRKKITNAGGKDYMETIYGVGYKFCEPQ